MFKYFASFVIAACVSMNAFAANSDDPNKAGLEQQLKAIAAKDEDQGSDTKKLEDECLALLGKFNSPAEKGQVYARIAMMYAARGYSSPNDMRIAKSAEFCKKALQEPLEPVTNALMYSELADTQIAYKLNAGEKEFAAARQKAIESYLTALKVVLDNNAPKQESPAPPKVAVHDITGEPNEAQIQKALQEDEANRLARQKWEYGHKLYILCSGLIRQCAELYSHKPYETAELERIARKTLKGHDDAVNEILAKVNEKTSGQGNK